MNRYDPERINARLSAGDLVAALGLNRRRWAADIAIMLKTGRDPRIEARLRARAQWVSALQRLGRHPLGAYERAGRGVVRNSAKAERRARRA
jgi:hypothetical protein